MVEYRVEYLRNIEDVYDLSSRKKSKFANLKCLSLIGSKRQTLEKIFIPESEYHAIPRLSLNHGKC